MSSTPVVSAIIQQLNAVLRLVTALSLSLTANEIIQIRQGLAYAYDYIGVVLEERNLRVEGVTSVCEFDTNLLYSMFTFLRRR